MISIIHRNYDGNSDDNNIDSLQYYHTLIFNDFDGKLILVKFWTFPDLFKDRTLLIYVKFVFAKRAAISTLHETALT